MRNLTKGEITALNKYRWIILILAYLCMLGFAFTLQSIPPVLPLIIRGLELTHGQAGLLMGLFALPAIVLSILAGLLSDRLGPFKIGVASISLIIVGNTILAISKTFLVACAGRAVAGTGAAIIGIVAAQMLSQWFGGQGIGTAMGIFNTAMPVGTIICFSAFGSIGERLGWRLPIFITVTVNVAVLIAFLILYKPAPESHDKTIPERTKKTGGIFSGLLRLKFSVWLVGLCWMWFTASVTSFSTFAPDFFVSKGYSLSHAGVLVSLLMWGSLGISPIIGRMLDRVNNGELLIGVGGLCISAAIFLVSWVDHFLFPMIIMTVAVALIPVPVFSFPSKLLKPEDLGLGFGILTMLSSLGMFFGPTTAGLVRHSTGSYEKSFIYLAILALLVTLTAFILKFRIKRDPIATT